MAVLTATELTIYRHVAAAPGVTVTWTKTQINAALQAIEDAVQSTSNVGGKTLKAYIAGAVETAVPGVFTANQKDTLFTIWSLYNARRGGVI